LTWKKLGLFYEARNNPPQLPTHAQMPVALQLHENFYRFFFAARDAQNRSHVCFVDSYLVTKTKKPFLVHQLPVLKPGPLGSFDGDGVFPSSIVNTPLAIYLYYIGWNRCQPAPLFRAAIGLAVSDDNGRSFQKISEGPIIDRSTQDPYLVTSPFVMLDEDIDIWRMWYTSGVKWTCDKHGRLKSFYNIKHALSHNGREWVTDKTIAINFQNLLETNVARPHVIKEGGTYKMWYCYDRGKGYRIGYAESPQGISWQRRDDQSGMNVSSNKNQWDGQMVAYPHILQHNGQTYMLYNGNNFGQEGFGLAMKEE
jgi:hypothetical protein